VFEKKGEEGQEDRERGFTVALDNGGSRRYGRAKKKDWWGIF